MPLLGTLLKKGIKIRESLEQEYTRPVDLQKRELQKLIISATYTAFGQHYNFRSILRQYKGAGFRNIYHGFREHVPIHTYNKMYEEWWHRCKDGEDDICWPGHVKYFALSSGTSDASSKYIPITRDMKRSIQRTGIRQILTLSHYDLPAGFFEGGILMLGGSTHLNNRGSFFEGDLSGIQASQIPFWFQHFYKPGKRISRTRDWEEKLSEISRRARDWNINIIVGVPAWIQLLMEKIIAHYQVDTIHDIWPNLQVYVHGGVSFDPYRKGFAKLLARDINYIETYLASEGFLAYQSKPDQRCMKLVLNNGIFYEFIPFDKKHFSETGDILPDARPVMISEVREGQDYAILITTNAGAWRYLIGDVIRFTSLPDSEIIITGRTKHFLSLCGEHLSIDNMNKAIEMVSDELNINIPEYTVTGIPYGTLFGHHWYIATDDPVDNEKIKVLLDKSLKKLNDDYEVERRSALKGLEVTILPTSSFYRYMEIQGKIGGQYKFPRVLKSEQHVQWKHFLEGQS